MHSTIITTIEDYYKIITNNETRVHNDGDDDDDSRAVVGRARFKNRNSRMNRGRIMTGARAGRISRPLF